MIILVNFNNSNNFQIRRIRVSMNQAQHQKCQHQEVKMMIDHFNLIVILTKWDTEIV